MSIQALKSCTLLRHPSTIAFVDSSNDSNDSISSSESNINTTSPISTSPPSSYTTSPRVVIRESKDDPHHPEDSEEVSEWGAAMHRGLPTLDTTIDANDLTLQDRPQQIARLLSSPTHLTTRILNVSLHEYSAVLSLVAEDKVYKPCTK
ncbi:hypothetical protein JVT61DRAFT_12319 [Boletus reticuloceps]|uniref:Uncharacterized protein n=1 Tax=Boletus reticuloceps TaxID=495285 RepID=A0A8I2YE40_9AGAM|nr:hypothetical protein JVT61DRAFT_12319 [Boletus reticuloceps]